MTDYAPVTVTTAERRLFRHVLHPTDLSADGVAAFAHALKVALAGRSDLSIVHTGAGLEASGEWSAFPQVRETLIGWGLLTEGASPDSVGELGLHVHKSDIGAAEPGKAVAHFADRHGCDLIVLATHPRRGLERWTRPSVAEPLAREAGLPTLFLPEGAAGFVDPASGAAALNTILVPVDDTPDPARAAALAVKLARAIGGEKAMIHLLHVGAGRPTVNADLAGSNIQWREAEGGVVEAICQTASAIDADLIVMATHGHDGFLDALRGSTTEQVLRRAARPLLAVPNL